MKHSSTYHLNRFRTAVIVMVLLFALSLSSLIVKDRTYSDNENRYLAQRPALTLSSVMSGKYMSDMEQYLSDQFFGRDVLVQARATLDLAEGKREINDVYVGDDHFLFEKPSVYEKDVVDRTVRTMNALSTRHQSLRAFAAIAPNATELLPDYLPIGAPTQPQEEQIQSAYSALSGITPIDLCTPLKAEKDPASLYYRTDHHWTAAAADIAFRQIAASMNLDTSLCGCRTLAVTNDFQGTMASSSGIFKASDAISVTVPQPMPTVVVSVQGEEEKRSSVFDVSQLSGHSKYDVFFGGNFPLIQIDTSSASDRVLLVIKDSYANCVVPMLLPYYRTILMVDPRYYTGDIDETIDQESVTDLLWLYNCNTFLKDTSISYRFSP